ncbi:MAG: HNH endonuclease [Thaumarchaeota archaeon]|nr:HNH endonuclease [Nitrososphaerota archaeon]
MGIQKKNSKCNKCGKIGHTSLTCYSSPKRPIKIKKHMRKVGKIGRQWISTRNEWIQKNLPDKVWYCHYCNKELTINILTLDHKLSRSRRPDLRFDLDNLVPCCWDCNSAKGSLSEEEYKRRIIDDI